MGAVGRSGGWVRVREQWAGDWKVRLAAGRDMSNSHAFTYFKVLQNEEVK